MSRKGRSYLPLVGWLLAGGVPAAQAQAELRAQVYSVSDKGPAASFTVPQVKLPSAAATARLNRSLIRLLLSGNETDSLASLPRQLQQAARSCCYDQDAHHWQVGQGQVGCSYEVLLNSQGLLSLAYTFDIMGAYSWEQTSHATFDLRTGRQLSLADVVADPPTRLRQRMRRAVSLRLGEALAQTQQGYADDTATISYVAQQFKWNWLTHQSAAGEEVDLTEFALTPGQLLLFYRVGFPHVAMNFEPDDTYRFAYRTLQLQPLLQPLWRARLTSKPKI